jgi:pimeloyl-ACP methyl ester carboxylesterase
MNAVGTETVVRITDGRGLAIHAVYNHLEGDRPLIIVPPQFEGSVRTNLLPLLYLIRNGFNVLRFDFTCHQGNSSGEFKDFTMSGALADLIAVVVDARRERVASARRLGLFVTSMAAPLMYRYLAKGGKVDVGVAMFGAVDMQYTIRQINPEVDLQHLLANRAHRYGTVKLWHFPIDGDRFAGDLIAHEFHTLDRVKRDIDAIQTPIYLVIAESDRWVRIEDYPKAFRDNQTVLRRTYKIPNAGHEVFRNLKAAKTAIGTATRCLREFYDLPGGFDAVLAEPTITEYIELNTREREREAAHKAP